MKNLVQTPTFKRIYKKIHQKQRPEINDAIREIIQNPEIGAGKKGDLAGIRVYKFRVQNQLYLLAYEFNETSIMLLALGVHENF
jgi:mRNA-degrading endonuclease RelE of RelBE toxin-antitoxin system